MNIERIGSKLLICLGFLILLYSVPFWVSSATTGIITCATEVRFSPNGGAEQMLIQGINGAKQSISIAIYSLTNSRIVDSLLVAHNRGISIRIMADMAQSTGKAQTIALARLRTGKVSIAVSRLQRTMHDKFMVVDHRVIFSGSYNYTDNAEHNNKENLLRLECPALAKQFEAEWATIE